MTAPVSRRAMDRIAALLAAAWPEEGCGWVSRSGRVEPAVNAADDPRRAYAFSFSDLLRFEAAFGTDDPPVAIYHSHPDGPARLSATDIRQALFEGEPLHPVRQIVVEIAAGRPRRFAEFRFGTSGYALCRRASLEEHGPWSA